MRSIDLNADLGEGFGVWRMGDDAAMLRLVTSANIACGFHAGDPEIMVQKLSRRESGRRRQQYVAMFLLLGSVTYCWRYSRMESLSSASNLPRAGGTELM